MIYFCYALRVIKIKGDKMKITLKAARTNANLTQAQAAKKLCVSKSTIANWEKGKSFPSIQKVYDVERIYGITYDDIIFLPRDSA